MNKVSHVIISRTITQFYMNHIRQEHEFTLVESEYTYGSLRPDMQANFLTQKHTWQESYGTLKNHILSILNHECPFDQLSIRLGEISHYCCDFFNLYHIDIVKYAQYRQHLLYELRLQHFYEVNQQHPHIVNRKAALGHILFFKTLYPQTTLDNLVEFLEIKKAHYLSEPDAYIKDVRYSYIVTTVVISALIREINHLYKDEINLNVGGIVS